MAFAKPEDARIRHLSRLFNALDSPQRLQILISLSERDYVVHELVQVLGKSQPLVSQHLRVLKRAGLVTSTRRGRESVYKLAEPRITELISFADSIAPLIDEGRDSTGGAVRSNH